MKRFGFTLAEVLITLGIIGIVAALTLPVLIEKHQKKVTEAQLKKNFSVISQVFLRAQVDHGELSNWDFSPQFDVDQETKNNMIEAFCQKYIIPYISLTKDCGLNRCHNKLNKHYKYPSGTEFWFFCKEGYSFITSNGAEYCFGWDTNTTIMLIYLDINSSQKGPNIFGRDVFVMSIRDKIFDMFTYVQNSEEERYNNCKSGNGYDCGWLIKKNGWKIPKDYPLNSF